MNVTNPNLSSIIEQTASIQSVRPLTKAQDIQPASALSESLQETLGVKENGEIDEEQFQHGLTKHILDDINPEAAKEYLAAFSKARESGQAVEDAVKTALQEVVQGGLLSAEDAEKINGVTFRAAQLDDNLEALYDGRGGENDPTVAKASLQEAIAKAEAVFQQAESGELALQARALDAPSNVAPNASSSHAAQAGAHSVIGGGSGEFLWKPQSESNGKLVVLLPSKYTGQVVKAGIYSSLPPSASNMVEEGRFAGDTHNGGRAHFRFGRSGGSYPDNSYVVAQLSNGQSVSFQVSESSARNTQ